MSSTNACLKCGKPFTTTLESIQHYCSSDPWYVPKSDYDQLQQKNSELQRALDAARAEIENLSIKLQRTVNAAQSALLETSAWMGIPEKKRENQINYAMENVKYCAEHDLRHQDISNLKNEYQKQLAEVQEELEHANALAKSKDERIADYETALEYYKLTWDVGIKAKETLNKWRGQGEPTD